MRTNQNHASAMPWWLAVTTCLFLPAVWITAAWADTTDETAGQATANTFNPTLPQHRPLKLSDPVAAAPPVDLDLVTGTIEERIERVLSVMTIEEKIGQMCQVAQFGDELGDAIKADLRAGRIGSLFYTGNAAQTREAQRIAQEESRLGLPLLTPRDVIHGFRTVFPIPLGQSASWNPELVEAACQAAAVESLEQGINWTFAPMMDVSRDARWGRIAESLGEDPVLAAELAAAMVRGYQGDDEQRGIAACAKHYVAYGLTEGGRDYNRAQVAISELHSVFLRPFEEAVRAGCATVMTGFSSINGVPPSGDTELVRKHLKERCGFEGLVVSDWGSVIEMIEHGYAQNRSEAARLAVTAGVDMEMASTTYQENLLSLIEAGALETDLIDDAVRRVLRVKFQYAMDDQRKQLSSTLEERRACALALATQSVVLLKNDSERLPLDPNKPGKIALIGPLADAARDQLGCWMLDGKAEEAVTLAAALREAIGERGQLTVAAGLESTIDQSAAGIADAVAAAKQSDVAILCVGEGWQLSGEARCRVDLNLPGNQSELVRAVTETGTPTILVVMAGRPLTIGDEAERCAAVLYAWHPGTMGGPALVNVLMGRESPSGKLPVTFPKHVGQSPLYYNCPNTGRPALAGTRALIGSGLSDFPEEQKYRSHYLDEDPFPLYPFGYGLSYTQFEYSDLELSRPAIEPGQTLAVRVRLTNVGSVAADEVAQLYVQDTYASLVRPVRELKAFRRVHLDPNESTILEFALSTDELAFFDNEAQLRLEAGEFRVGVGGDSTVPLSASFQLREATVASDRSLPK
ncbi:glycoside hydrolase family 3 N-terminal domain-containing protein [Botrimarina hoheduenensis]|uniref:beta-glucosidase n=1 Tax=Botrimarina hoheduenensis TaxID=2528000 RepID=A0A5C5WBC4_9BACT|nr:glycoside hydrolase family 3 N-terminal domain-containing protein [Botrimarina hoheduenensis]TWT47543.1 Periplasmic beta-glucosidase precursor [Botrimarina hoheduenensis]